MPSLQNSLPSPNKFWPLLMWQAFKADRELTPEWNCQLQVAKFTCTPQENIALTKWHLRYAVLRMVFHKLAIVSLGSGDFFSVSVAPISGEKWYVKGHESFVTKQVSDLRLLSRLRLLCMENVNVVNPGPILLDDGILSVSVCAHTSFESCMKYRHSIVPSCHVLKESMSSTRALVFGGKNKQHPSRFKALWKYLF